MNEQTPHQRLADAVKALPPNDSWSGTSDAEDAICGLFDAARALLDAPDDAESDNNLPPDYDWIRKEMPRHVDWVKTHEWKHPDGRSIYCPSRTWRHGVQMRKGHKMPTAVTRGQVRRFIATGLLPCEVPATAPDDAAELRAVKALVSEANDGRILKLFWFEQLGRWEVQPAGQNGIGGIDAPTATELCAKLGVPHD